MSLRRCPACGNQVELETGECPICGRRYLSALSGRILRWGLILFLILFAVHHFVKF
jgi:hypothetical protein